MHYLKLTLLIIISLLLSGCEKPTIENFSMALDYQRIDADWLTHEEANLRKWTISNVKYSLQLDLTKSKRYSGTVEIAFDYLPSLYPLTVDFVGGEAERIFVNRKTIAIDYDGNFINIPTQHLERGYNTIKIQYSHPYSDNGSGLYRYQDPKDNKVYLYTFFEPYNSNKLFPSFDQPNLRATYKLKVVVPKNWTVVTSVREEKVIDDGPYKRWHFPESANFSTYVFPLHAGPWHVWEGKAGKTPLRLMTRESLASLIDVRQWFRITQQGFRFYEKYFSMNYPYSKYDQLLVPDFNIGGMENVAAVTFTENYIPSEQPSLSLKREIADTILHELAHMWFGNMVTIDWWNSLWLKESFASYMAPLALTEATDYKQAWRSFNANIKQKAYQADQRVTTHPIDMPVADTKSGDASFDSITYNKGAAVLQQLTHSIGEQNFRDGIRTYLSRHKNESASVSDFFSALSDNSGEQLHSWAQRWINTAGLNTIIADYQCERGSISKFRLLQSAAEEYPVLRNHRLQVALYQINELRQIEASTIVPVSVEGKMTEVVSLLGKPCPLMVYPNHGDWGYIKVQLDHKTLLILPDNLYRVKNPLQRIMFWQSLWNMVLEVKMPVTQYLNLVLNNIIEENDPENLNLLLSNVLQARDWLRRGSAMTPSAKESLADLEFLMLNQSQDAAEGSESQKIWFSYFVKIAQSEQSLNHLSLWLQGTAAPHILSKDQGRRWNAIIQLSSHGHQDTEALIKLESLRDTSDKGTMMRLAAEASQPNLSVKQYWLDQFMLEENRQSAARLKQAMDHLFPVGQKQFHLPFAEKILTDLHISDRLRGQVFVENMVNTILPSLCSETSVALLNAAQQQMASLGLTAQKGLRIAHQEDARCVAINALIANQ